MLSKLLMCLSLVSVFFACSTAKVVKLSPAKGASKEFGSRSHFVEVIDAGTNQINDARSLGLDSFFIGRFNYYPTSYSIPVSGVNASKNDSLVHQQNNFRIKTDTTEDFPLINYKTEILFLFGKRLKGDYLVVADQNNNKSFTDDTVFVFKNIQEDAITNTGGLDSLPHVTIKNVKSYYNNKIADLTLHLLFELLLFNETENKRTLALRIVSKEYNEGKFKYKKEKYKVAVRNALLPYLYFDPQAVKIKFANASDTAAFQGIGNRHSGYFIGDTAHLGERKFIIKKVSPMLDKVKIMILR